MTEFLTVVAPMLTASFLPTAMAPLTSPDILKLRSEILDAETQMNTLSKELQASVPTHAALAITALMVAMTKLFKVAVAIKGDYKPQDIEDSPMRQLLNQAAPAFGIVEEQAKAGVTNLTGLNAKVSKRLVSIGMTHN
jgi:hypothetical protein